MESPSHLFEQLLRQVGKTRQLARSLLGDESAAEDAVQEIWASASRRQLPEPPEPWLKTALRNRLLNQAREQRRRTAREEKSSPGAAPDSPEELLARLEMHRKLVEAVARLAEPYRQAVLLRYFEELSSAEIGERLGIPAGTVRGRLKTAVDLLRADLDRAPGGRRGWMGAMVLLAGGGRLAPELLGGVAQAAAGGSSITVKLVVALALAGSVGTAIVVRATRPEQALIVRTPPPPPARFTRLPQAEPPPSVREPTPAAVVKEAPAGATARTAPSSGAAVVAVFGFAGTVSVNEKPPQPARVRSNDPSCLYLRDETIKAYTDGALDNVVIRVVSPAAPVGPPPVDPLVIEQSDCAYQPRVAVARTGQPIQLRTRDQVLHRPNTTYGRNDAIGVGPLSMGTPPVDLAGPKLGEKLLIGCDLHPFMKAIVLATDNPWFAISNYGRFRVGGMPAGTYTVEAWHEHYGAQRAEVTIGPEQPLAILDFVFGKEPRPPVVSSGPFSRNDCQIAVRGDSPVVKACSEGGIKKAKSVMKAMQKLGKSNGLKFECDECHKDESAGNWALKDGAEAKFKKLLHIAR